MPPLALRCRDGFGLFCLVALQGKQQLPGVELFAARAEDPPHEQVDLFAQQPDLLRLSRVLPAQGLVLLGEAGFQWRHLGHGNVVVSTTTPAIVQVIG